MFQIKAKYNFANIMLPDESYIDNETKKQIYRFLNHLAFTNTYIAIMPDCHAGAGSCIGFTMKMNDYIIPNIVGVDIGCGVKTVCLGKRNIDLKSLDNFIKNEIPNGFNVNSKEVSSRWMRRSDLNTSEIYDEIDIVSSKVESDPRRNRISLGSLGGGNHFIELGVDETSYVWLTVHTGSRTLGLDIAKFYQNKAKELMKTMFTGSAYKNLEFLPKENTNFSFYLKDMAFAQKFASLNRAIILNKLMDFIEVGLPFQLYVESIHNYIDFDTAILRKGAVRALKNEPLVISFNMEDGLIIGYGKGNTKWNLSAPHGAGRILSRSQAKKQLDLQKAKLTMEKAGVYTTSLNENTLDETKGAYKSKDLIVECIKESVDIEKFIKPIYNFKAEA